MNDKAKKMISTLRYWHCTDIAKMSDEDIDKMVKNVYNEAIRDCEDFIDVMIQRNPRHKLTLMALKAEMFPGSYIGDETK